MINTIREVEARLADPWVRTSPVEESPGGADGKDGEGGGGGA